MTTDLVDNRRAPCAIGLVLAARRMAALPAGAVMEIWSRDRFAPTEIAVWAERDGYRLTSHRRAGLWPMRYHVFTVVKPGAADS